MHKENKMEQAAETPKQVQQTESANFVQADKKTLRPMELLNEATKFTIFGAFTLYALGFLIWHAYLADYGVSSIQFLQTEYLSAAFCYLLVVALFGVPAALIFEEWFSAYKKRRADFNSSKTNIQPAKHLSATGAIVSVWLFTNFQLYGHIFPFVSKPAASAREFWHRIEWIGGLIIVATILLYSGKHFLLKRYKGTRYGEFIQLINPGVCLLGAICLYQLGVNTSVSKPFLIFTIGFYPLIVVHFWASEGKPAVRTVVIIGFVIALLLHAQTFGSLQFGKISRSWGWGKPETAYVKFAPSSLGMPTSLGLSSVEGVPLLKDFYGPVSILLRSDKELVFVNFAELNFPQYGTNYGFVGLSTNTTSTLVTNIFGPVKVGSGKHQTNQDTATPTYLVTNYVQTNLVATLVANPVRLTAKQIRSDAVDILVYAK